MGKIGAIVEDVKRRVERLNDRLEFPKELREQAEAFVKLKRSEDPLIPLYEIIGELRMYPALSFFAIESVRENPFLDVEQWTETVIAYLNKYGDSYKLDFELLSSEERQAEIETALPDVIFHTRAFFLPELSRWYRKDLDDFIHEELVHSWNTETRSKLIAYLLVKMPSSKGLQLLYKGRHLISRLKEEFTPQTKKVHYR